MFSQRHALVLGTALALQVVAFGHGGSYPGPGDTVPPGSGGSPDGGGTPDGPVSPTGPTGPDSPTPAQPGQPGLPGQPAGTGPTTDPSLLAPDSTHWSFWWDLNKARYLNLRETVWTAAPRSSDDDFWLGTDTELQLVESLRPSPTQIREEVVPALLRALSRESNRDVVSSCLMALAKIGDQQLEDGRSPLGERFSHFLASNNQEISETAALALGILGNDASAPILMGILRDDATGRGAVGGSEVSFRTRAFAAYGLALLGARTADMALRESIVAELVAPLESPRTSGKDVPVACLIGLGLVPLEPASPADGEAAGPPRSLEDQLAYLLEILGRREADSLVRAHVPTSLARLLQACPPGERELWKERIALVLTARLGPRSKETSQVQQSCALALGLVGDDDDDREDQAIRACLIDASTAVSDQTARRYALIALAQTAARAGGGTRSGEGRALAQRHLSAQLARGRSGMPAWAGLAIGVLGHGLAEAGLEVPSELRLQLRSALEDAASPDEVGAWCIGAALLGDALAAPIVHEKLLEVRDPETRGFAAVALGLLRYDPARADLIQLCQESKYRPVQLKRCAVGLGLMRDKSVVGLLVDMLGEASSLSSQASISSALGFIGDRNSVEPLVQALEDPTLTARARAFAAVALGLVGEKDLLPWNTPISENLNYDAATETLNTPEGTGIVNIL